MSSGGGRAYKGMELPPDETVALPRGDDDNDDDDGCG
jgi:hypothetical protein